MAELKNLPAFPKPEFSDVDAAFGADSDAYLTREQLGEWYGFPSSPFHDAASGIFSKGEGVG